VGAPTVTVGIPLYERREYVEGALKSAARQDYANVDILVSDNGENPDELRTWVEDRMEGRRFRFRRNDSTVDLTRHFNQLVEEARGDYFVLLCDDDEISPNYVSSLAKHLTEDPEIAVAVARADLIDESGHRRPKEQAHFPAGVHPCRDFIRIWCGHEYDFGSFVTNMARTESIKAAGGYPDFVKGNSIDNALLIALSVGHKVALVDGASFLYRIYESSTGLAADYRELGKAQRQFLRYLDRHPNLRAYEREDPAQWKSMKDQIVEMAWRTYRHRWKNMYRDRLSRGEWARAAFQMPFIPAYYKAVLPHLFKSVIRGR